MVITSSNRDRVRMKHALFGLIHAPQHQLKICKNGKEVYGSEIRQDLSEILCGWFPQPRQSSAGMLDEFVDIVIEALLSSPNPVRSASDKVKDTQNMENHSEGNTINPDRELSSGDVIRPTSETRKTEVQSPICGNSPFYASNNGRELELTGLPEGCVLECMSRLQQMDQLNIEDVFLLHSTLTHKMEADPQLRRRWRWDGPYRDTSWILGDHNPAGSADPVEEDVLKVKRFLVSKTLQDCSIIVAVKPLSHRPDLQESNNCLSFRGEAYEYSIGIIDLDPKCFDKVPFYYHQSVDIASAFQDLTS